jgi:creatinine amidohydrolase
MTLHKALPVAEKYVYGDLTWPEINEAASQRKVILLPIGSTEQHGPHLPLDVDNLLSSSVCLEAGRRAPDVVLVAPQISYGYNIHAIDYPGTMHVGYEHLIGLCPDLCKSFACHGFKRIVILNAHDGNSAALELASRRAIFETDSLVTSLTWWSLLPADFVASVRESVFPGGAGHAGKIETSVYLHLAEEKVRMDKARNHIAWYNAPGTSSFQWGDLFGSGPVSVFERTSSFTEDGISGEATLATAEMGKLIFDQAVTRLVEFVREFQNRTQRASVDHHTTKPTSPLPEP